VTATVKRFFEADEADGDVIYTMVAADLGHARWILRNAGVEFGDPSVGFDEADRAGLLVFRELTPPEVAKRRCHTEDARGVVPLAECEIGEWFCSEW
jgi:hypothetical protein